MQPFRARLRIFFVYRRAEEAACLIYYRRAEEAAYLIYYRRAGEGTGSKIGIELSFCRLPAERGRVWFYCLSSREELL